MAIEKYILTVGGTGMHLGNIKETFGRGTVIEYDDIKNLLIIDGRIFDNTKDMDIMKRQAVREPDSPWLVPYSDEAYAYLKGVPALVAAAPKPRPGENMPVIQSDEDMSPSIDVRHTQMSRLTAEQKEADRHKAATEKLEIIKGDESPEERRDRLAQESRGMPVVHDDSLGQVGGSAATSLNAGLPMKTREEIEAGDSSADLIAEARKKDAEATRAKMLSEQAAAAGEVSAPDSDAVTELRAENENLKEQLGSLNSKLDTLLSVMAQQPATQAAPVSTVPNIEDQESPATATTTTPTPEGEVERSPVTDPVKAEEMEELAAAIEGDQS